MLLSDLRDLAETGTAKDIVGLLKAYGDVKASDGRDDCINWIIDGINDDGDAQRRKEKRSMVADYVGKQGVFIEGNDVPANVVQEFKETVAELTKEVKELRALVEERLEERTGLRAA